MKPTSQAGRKLRAVALSLALASALGGLAPASAAPRWVPAGPEGGTVVGLAVDGAETRIVYAALQSGGTWRSEDGGESWMAARTGLPQVEIRALAADPEAAGTLFAGLGTNGIWKSQDGGRSWSASAARLDGRPVEILALAADPATGDLWAGLAPKEGQAPLYRSEDGGATWTAIDLGAGTEGVQVKAVAFAGDDVYAGTRLHGLFRGPRTGGAWTQRFPDLDVFGLAASPGVLYASAASGFWLSRDRGETWTRTITPPEPIFGRPSSQLTLGAVAVSSVNPAAVCVAFRLQLGLTPPVFGLYRSGDGGSTFSSVQGGFPGVFPGALLFEPGSGRLLAGAGALGVWTSADGAAGWRSSNRGMRAAPVYRILADPKRPAILFAGVQDVGTMRSTDRGATWQRVNQGDQFVLPEALDPQQPATLYAFGFRFFSPGFLGKGTNGGRRWSMLALGADGLPVAFALDPVHPERLYVLTNGFDTPVLRSRDGGQSWVRSSLRCLDPRVLAVSPAGAVYAGGGSRCGRVGEIEGGVYRSDDGGVAFRNRIAGLPQRPKVNLLAVDPARPRNVFAGLEYFASFSEPSRFGVFRSRNQGEQWEAVPGLSDLGVLPTDFAFAPFTPSSIWLATSGRGLWRSGDAGATFRPAATLELPTDRIHDLEFDRSRPASLYAATPGGLFRLGED